jgi:hypothetical protein
MLPRIAASASTVFNAIHEAVTRLGAPKHASVLEPGCDCANFMAHAPTGWRLIGVELPASQAALQARCIPSTTSGAFSNSRLPSVDLVIGTLRSLT